VPTALHKEGDIATFEVERLGKFSLKVEPTKTKVIEFGRFAVRTAKQKEPRFENKLKSSASRFLRTCDRHVPG